MAFQEKKRKPRRGLISDVNWTFDLALDAVGGMDPAAIDDRRRHIRKLRVEVLDLVRKGSK